MDRPAARGGQWQNPGRSMDMRSVTRKRCYYGPWCLCADDGDDDDGRSIRHVLDDRNNFSSKHGYKFKGKR